MVKEGENSYADGGVVWSPGAVRPFMPEVKSDGRVPSEDVRKVRAYLDGYLSGLQHAEDALKANGQDVPVNIEAEQSAIYNIVSFIDDEFGEVA